MIVVVGLSHKTAPIEVRERLAFSEEGLPEILRRLVRTPPITEAVVVSTCNRVEFVVAGPEGPRSDLPGLARAIRAAVDTLSPGVQRHLYEHTGPAAVRHLFRVAASLDSLVIGEPQILGQLKGAYDLARAAGTTGPVLNRVVPRAVKSAKRVRSETAIGAGQVSVPSVAIDLARQIFGDFSSRSAALVGSGEMGETVARLLHQAGAKLAVVGRNPERVAEIAAILGGTPRSFADLEATLVEADVVITTTSAPGFVVDYDKVAKARRARRGRNLFFIDLAVPRDVDPRVNALDGVFLYNVDDLSKVVAESVESRLREADHAEEIVAEEAIDLGRWAEAEQATPTIVALRERFRGFLQVELERSLSGKLRHLGAPDREALSVMIEASLNKLLHQLTSRLRRLATEPASRADLELIVSALHDLFELDVLETVKIDPAEISADVEAAGAPDEPSFAGPASSDGASPHAEDTTGLGTDDPKNAVHRGFRRIG